MNRAERFFSVEQRAEALLRDKGILELPVDPFSIAESEGIIVEPKPDTAKGVSGMLLRDGDTFGIMYATDIQNEGFQRFSIAHELGHYFLEGHPEHVLDNGHHASHAGFSSSDHYELEADHFAASLLMPHRFFKVALGKYAPGLDAILEMADLCKTSLTATAIRYTELTDDAVAIIVSIGPIIDYGFLSGSMKSFLGSELMWPRKGTPVPQSTETARFNAEPDRVTQNERSDGETDLMDWLGGRESVMVTEEVIGLGEYGKTLTVLSSESLDQDDDEEGLVESWTPRFRR
uniref:IrrE N-terminal-like domain-containing protein n=1 Tax=Candidatus Kentrum sp. FW TaxID=2126338 RepID=A0A450TYM4_9GAMM|nr:MAG: protein of unknown function (DUF955) [Candidatus Kentron sp. FW]